MGTIANAKLQIDFLPVNVAEDEPSVVCLTQAINDIYAAAETGIFVPSHTRTNQEEVKKLIVSRQLAVATLGSCNNRLTLENLKGCIRVAMLSPTTGNLGTLCTISQDRKAGVGKQLVRFAEDHCRSQGASRMQIELVVPTTYELPLKVWIQSWYERMGYEVIANEDFRTHLPHLADNLITPVVFRIFQRTF